MDSSPPTPPPGSADGFADWEVDTAKAVVRSFVAARGPFAMHDFDDLVQECLLRWWQQRSLYSEGRGANRRTFMNRVLMNRLRDLRRQERAQKRRGDREARSLDKPLGNEGDDLGSLTDLLPDEGAEGRPDEAAERAELAEGIDRVRRRLTLRRRELLDGISAGFSMSELSRLLATPRSTLYDERERIKQEFRAEGLDDFLW